MKTRLSALRLLLPLLVIVLVGAGLAVSVVRVEAYPEYAMLTGESCGVCHFNSAGGGPRTPRGELWVIGGRPDVVPELPGAEEAVEETAAPAEEETTTDEAESEASGTDLVAGAQLFELFTCGNCHGPQGEGSADSPPLNQEVLSAELISQTVRTGPETMPAIPEQLLSDDQMEDLVLYVQNLATGRSVRVELLDALGPIFVALEEDGGSQ